MNYKKLLSFLVLCTFCSTAYGSKEPRINSDIEKRDSTTEFFQSLPPEIANLMLHFLSLSSEITTKNGFDIRCINTRSFREPSVVEFFLRRCQTVRLAPEDKRAVFQVGEEQLKGSHKIVESIIKNNSAIKFNCWQRSISLYALKNLGYDEKGNEFPFKKDGKVSFYFIGSDPVEFSNVDFQLFMAGTASEEVTNLLLKHDPKKLIVVPNQSALPFELLETIIQCLTSSNFDFDQENSENKRFQILKKNLEWMLESPDMRHVKNSYSTTFINRFISRIFDDSLSNSPEVIQKTKLLFPLFEKYCLSLVRDQWPFLVQKEESLTPVEVLFEIATNYRNTVDTNFFNAINEAFSMLLKSPSWQQNDRIDTTCSFLNLFFSKTTSEFRILLFSLFQQMKKLGVVDLYLISRKTSDSEINGTCIACGEYPLKLFLKRLIYTTESIGGAQTIFKECVKNDLVEFNQQDENGNTVIHLLNDLCCDKRKTIKEKAQSMLSYSKKLTSIDLMLQNKAGISINSILEKN